MTILRFLGGLHYAPLPPAGVLLVRTPAGGEPRVVGTEGHLRMAVQSPSGYLTLAPWTSGEDQDPDPAPIVDPFELRDILPGGIPGAVLPWVLPAGSTPGRPVPPPAAAVGEGTPRHHLNLLIMHYRKVAAADPVAGRIALNILDAVGLYLR